MHRAQLSEMCATSHTFQLHASQGGLAELRPFSAPIPVIILSHIPSDQERYVERHASFWYGYCP